MRTNTIFVCFVALTVCLYGFANAAGPTSQSFEDGSVASWLLSNSYYSLTTIAGGAANTSKALALVGGQQQNLDGAQYTFDAWSPSSISFWIKAGVVGNVGGIMLALGNDTTTGTNIIVEFRFKSSGTMGIITPSATTIGITYTANTWYNIRFDFNWAANTFDFLVNNAIVPSGSGLVFKNNKAQLNTVFFFNSGTSTSVSYLDELYIGCPNGCTGSSCNQTTGKCMCSSSCGLDCSLAPTKLTKGYANYYSGVTVSGVNKYFSYDPQGEAFDIIVSNPGSSLYLYMNQPANVVQCTTFAKSISSNNVGSNLVYNITQCDIRNYPTGEWFFAVASNYNVKYTITIVKAASVLANNRPVRVLATISTQYYFTYTVPASVADGTTLTVTGSSNTYLLFYGSNSTCPTTSSSTYAWASTSSFVSTYTKTVPAIAGTTWYFMTYQQSTSSSSAYLDVNVKLVDPTCALSCGNGVCAENKCACNPGYTGSSCTDVQCPSDCNGVGTCNKGVCSCNAGWSGKACQCVAATFTNTSDSIVYGTWNYYNLDTSNYPWGATVSVTLEGGYSAYIYYGIAGCLTTQTTSTSTTNSYWISSGTNTISLSQCTLNSYGNQYTIGVYAYSSSLSSYNYNMSVAANPGPSGVATGQLWTATTSTSTMQHTYYDTPAGSTTVMFIFTGNYYYFYISNVTCPSSSNYLYYNSYSSSTKTITISSPSGRYYIGMAGASSGYTAVVQPLAANCNTYCNDNGVCNNGKCVCFSGYGGTNCDTKNSCSSNCNYRGNCVAKDTCECTAPYSGADCSCAITAELKPNQPITATSTSYQYYLLNASNFPNGFEVNVTGYYMDLYYDSGACPGSSYSVSTGGSFTSVATVTTANCATGKNLKKTGYYIFKAAAYSGAYTLVAGTPTGTPAGAQLTTAVQWSGYVDSGYKYIYFDVPSTATSVMFVVSGGYWYNYLYISNTTCPTSSSYISTTNTYSSKTSSVTLSGVAGQRLYLSITNSVTSSYTASIQAFVANCNKYCGDNGVCTDGACKCFSGYMGATCETSYSCSSSCTNNGGVCVGPSQCQCPAGKVGSSCECTMSTNITAVGGIIGGNNLYNSGNGVTFYLDTSAFPNGFQVNVTSAYAFGTVYLYYSAEACASTYSYSNYVTGTGAVSASTVSTAVCSTSYLSTGKRYYTFVAYSSSSYSSYGYTISVNAINTGTASLGTSLVDNALWSGVTASSSAPNYFVYNVPTGATSVQFQVTSDSYNYAFLIGTSACPSSSSYSAGTTSTYSSSNKWTVTSPPSVLYIVAYSSSYYGEALNIKPIASTCNKYCSGTGVCNNNVCVCDTNYYGSDCSTYYVCSSSCSSNGGTCVGSYQCQCPSGKIGANCECSISGNTNLTASNGFADAGTDLYGSGSGTRYYLDTSAFPNGFQVTLASTQSSYSIRLYYGAEMCTSTSSYTSYSSGYSSVTISTASSSVCSSSSLQTGKKYYTFVAYSSYSYPYTISVTAAAAPATPPALSSLWSGTLPSSSSPKYLAYDVPTGAKSVTFQVTTASAYSWAFLISSSTCPTSSSYTYGTTSASSTSGTYTVTNPPSKLYIAYYSTYSSLYVGYAITVQPIVSNCNANCGYGVCLDNQCSCYSGYSGTNCTTAISCSGVNYCNGNGVCVDTDVCKCAEGTVGDNCQCSILGAVNLTASAGYTDSGSDLYGTSGNGNRYYLDTTAFPNGFQVTLNSTSPNSVYLYYGAEKCASTNSYTSYSNGYGSVTLSTAAATLCSSAALQTGKKYYIFIAYSYYSYPYTISVKAATAPAQPPTLTSVWSGTLPLSGSPGYLVYNVPTGSKSVTFQVTTGSSYYWAFLISSSACPTSSTYTYGTPSASSTSGTYTVTNPPSKLYIAYYSTYSSSGSMTIQPIASNCDLSCGGNGACNDNKCTCYSGYTDTNCTTAVSCSGVNNCYGNGKCVGTDTCECVEGTIGDNCQCRISGAISADATTTGVFGSGTYYTASAADFPNGLQLTLTSQYGSSSYIYYVSRCSASPTSSYNYLSYASTSYANGYYTAVLNTNGQLCAADGGGGGVSTSSDYLFYITSYSSSSYTFSLTATPVASIVKTIPSSFSTVFTSVDSFKSFAISNTDGASFVIYFKAINCNYFSGGIYVKYGGCASKANNTKAITSADYTTKCSSQSGTAGILFDPAPIGTYYVTMYNNAYDANITVAITSYTKPAAISAGVSLSPAASLWMVPLLCALLFALRKSF